MKKIYVCFLCSACIWILASCRTGETPGASDESAEVGQAVDVGQTVAEDKTRTRITSSRAEELIAAEMGVERSEIVFYRNYLCCDRSGEYYDIECSVGGRDCVVSVDAYSGRIINTE